MSPSVVSINLREKLTDLRKTVYSLDCQVITKDRNQQSDGEIPNKGIFAFVLEPARWRVGELWSSHLGAL